MYQRRSLTDFVIAYTWWWKERR